MEQTFDRPEGLGEELRDLLVAVDDEAECGELAGAVRDDLLSGELRAERSAESQGLQPRERSADAQVELLAHVYCIIRCFVQCGEGAKCVEN